MSSKRTLAFAPKSNAKQALVPAIAAKRLGCTQKSQACHAHRFGWACLPGFHAHPKRWAWHAWVGFELNASGLWRGFAITRKVEEFNFRHCDQSLQSKINATEIIKLSAQMCRP
jgi:hypothetical protein